MRIIIAPAKQMKEDTDTLLYAESPEELKAFDRSYRFDEGRSSETEYVFIKS